MADYELRYLPIFYEDLLEAVDYIQGILKNPQAAANLTDQIETAILERLNCPEAFEPCRSKKDRKNVYYPIYVKNYVIYYVVLDHRIMEVRRFLYKGRNRSKLV